MSFKGYATLGLLALLVSCGQPPSGSTPNTSSSATTTSAATAGTTNAPTMQSGSGIEGRVVIGPICPVQRINQPCPPRPYKATIDIMDSGKQPVTQAQSDDQGHFRVDLPAGTYTLVPASPGVYPRAAPQTVTVAASTYVSVTIEYDSGIR